MIVPLLEIPLRPRQRHHGGGSDGVGLLVLNMDDGGWQGHRLDAGTDDTPVVMRPLDRDSLCSLLHEVIAALDATGRVN